MKGCPLNRVNMTTAKRTTWVDVGQSDPPPVSDLRWNDELVDLRNRSKSDLGDWATLNASVEQLVKKAEQLPSRTIRIWLPSTISCALMMGVVGLLIWIKRRRSRVLDRPTQTFVIKSDVTSMLEQNSRYPEELNSGFLNQLKERYAEYHSHYSSPHIEAKAFDDEE